MLGQKAQFDLKKINSGPYFGIQKGRNLVLEMGFEKRLKEIKFTNPKSQGFSFGANYDINEFLLGFDAGYWCRPSPIGFTVGGQLAYRTNFDNNMIGLAPVLGYKIWFLHANVGCYLYPKVINNVKTNNLFINLRWVINKNSKFKKN